MRRLLKERTTSIVHTTKPPSRWVLKINHKGKVHSENCEARNDAGSSAAGSGREQALASVLEDPDATGEADGSETSEGI